MSEEEIEKLAFTEKKQLLNLNRTDLLTIIEFLQTDRKQWINEYSNIHNKSIDMQKENQQSKERIKTLKNTQLKQLKIIQEKDDELDLYKSVIDEIREFNYIVSNSDYVYLQDEIANKNLEILAKANIKDINNNYKRGDEK